MVFQLVFVVVFLSLKFTSFIIAYLFSTKHFKNNFSRPFLIKYFSLSIFPLPTLPIIQILPFGKIFNSEIDEIKFKIFQISNDKIYLLIVKLSDLQQTFWTITAH